LSSHAFSERIPAKSAFPVRSMTPLFDLCLPSPGSDHALGAEVTVGGLLYGNVHCQKSILQRQDEAAKLKSMHQRERGLSQDVVQIWIFPMMPGAEWDC
jgi:hypothetical protein